MSPGQLWHVKGGQEIVETWTHMAETQKDQNKKKCFLFDVKFEYFYQHQNLIWKSRAKVKG